MPLKQQNPREVTIPPPFFCFKYKFNKSSNSDIIETTKNSENRQRKEIFTKTDQFYPILQSQITAEKKKKVS